MLTRLRATGFKSLHDVQLEFPGLAVFFGPNASGKSNLLDSIIALSRVATERTLADAISDPIRGYPHETLSLPGGGLGELLASEHREFELEADLETSPDARFRYRVRIRIAPSSGKISVADEYLCQLTREGRPKGTAAIEVVDGSVRIRRSNGGRPPHEPLGASFTALSDVRWSGDAFRQVEAVRREFSAWRTYYLDPRVAMRSAQPPSDVTDIGVHGEHIAPFLYKLKGESPKAFDSVARTLRTFIPSIKKLDVELDKRRGTLDLMINQDGIDYSSRVVSEGTLRVLALCAIATNPWGGTVISFEEPENGVHPRRLSLIAKLLISLARRENRQVIVTTHSPLFCDSVLREMHSGRNDIGLFNIRRRGRWSTIERFRTSGPMFDGPSVAESLVSEGEDREFSALVVRGLIDE